MKASPTSRRPRRATAGAGPQAPVAIVGAACRLPGAADMDAFWSLLSEGRDAVTQVPADRFNHAAWLHPRRQEPGKTYTFAAGVLGDVLGFDHAVFGLSPREAAEMDPQQRLILELVREAFEDAGWPESVVAGRDLGVYMGASTTDWGDLRIFDPAGADRYMMTGAALSIVANRVTNIFDLRGPAQTIDTACSSALVALHHACEALRLGRIPAAVVGGVNMLLSPFPFGGFARASMLSPNGRCHAFDARADGYVRAEGGAVVVLKRLDQALADGDAVHGVILASRVNAAGRTVGLSLPNQQAQAALLKALLADAAMEPDRIGYFEAHGTGTAAGDPIEASAIGEAVGSLRTGPAMPIGSAKTNIGHTEAASGLVGLVKGLLMLRHGQIPPSLHFETPNPNIDFSALGLRVATKLEKLGPDPVLGINSFGFGGTNAGILVAAPPARAKAAARAGKLPALLLSARSDGALAGLAEGFAAALETAPAARAAALIRGQAAHRDLLPHRLVARGTAKEMAARLRHFVRHGEAEGLALGRAARGEGVAFVFSGNGAQWPGMAQSAIARNAGFRAAIRAVDRELRPLLGWSVARSLAEGVDAAQLAATDHAQPLLFAVQVALVAALAEHGIRPALVLGHSVGEAAAAHVAGLLDLPAACRLIVARSRHQHATRGQGRMAALGASAAAALPVLAACSSPGEPPLEVAAINAPGAITVAGPPAALARLDAAAKEKRWSFIPLDLDYAFHSSFMDPARVGLMADLRRMRARPPTIPMVSSVTAEPLTAADCNAAYWWRNLRQPVRFEAALASTAPFQPRLFIEIGPNPVLLSYLREGLRAAGSEAAYIHSLSKRDEAGDPLPWIVDRATASGADPRGAGHYAGPTERQGLPRAPFQRVPAPMPRTGERLPVPDPTTDHPLLGQRRGHETREWLQHLDLALQPWLADHRLAGDAVLPAAAMLDMALAAGAARHPEAAALEVAEFHILRAMPLEAERTRELRSRLDEEGLFSLESRRRLSEEPWSLHARGQVREVPRLPGVPAALAASADRQIDTAHLVAMAHAAGLDYGPAFQPVATLAIDAAGRTARAALRLPETAPPDAPFLLHPVRLDGAMQGMIGLLEDAGMEAGHGFVPVRATRLVVRRGAPPAASADIRLVVRGERSAAADLVLRDGAGEAVAVLEGCWVQKLRLPGRTDAGHDIFRIEQVPMPPAADAAPEIDIETAMAGLEVADQEAAIADATMLLEGYAAAAAGESLAAGMPASPYADALATLAGDDALPPRGEIWRQVLLEEPGLAHELAWLADAAERAGLSTRTAAPMPSSDARSFDTIARLLAGAVRRWAAAWPAGRPLRVLEIAAAPGPLTRLLAAALAASGRPALLHAASLPDGRSPYAPPTSLGQHLEFAISAWDPLGAEPPPLLADIVVGLLPGLKLRGQLHGGDVPLAEALRHAVLPGGALILAEALPGTLWDFTLGQDPAWWQAPPPPDETAWSLAVSDTGWQDVAVHRLASVPMPVAVLAARAPAGPSALPGALPRRLVLVADEASMPLRAALAQLAQARGAEVLGGSLAQANQISARSMQGAVLMVMLAPDHAIATTLSQVARLAAGAQGAVASFRLVTRGAATEPGSAAAQAMARVMANEMPGLKPRRIDLAAAIPVVEAARRLLAELQHEQHAEAEIAVTAAGRMVPRLLPGLPVAPPQPGPLMLVAAQPGQLGSLHWTPIPPREPGEGEVAIRVEAAGLNFRDLMWAQGLLPEETLMPGFAGPGLGLECAGIVEAIGPGTAWQLGDAVFGFAPRALASRVITRGDALAARPLALSPAAAATIPVAFMTAVYALEEMARLEPGEVVLIHGGAGAVGLAAMQVALGIGARIVATAGSPAKRAFLREAGAELVLDSRDPGFADRLRAAGIDGIDVALNSLAGEAMERTLGLMRPFGRFIELGKRDYAENRRVSLRPMRRNVTYFAVDVDELPRARPAVAARLLAGIADRLADGRFQPLPHALREADEAEAAFRVLQASGQIGKLVIAPPAQASAGLARDWHPGEGIVVVLGGVQGFGLSAAQWLAGQGVKRLALVSRRGAATPGADAALASLGAEARAYACDATDSTALAATLDAIRRGGSITGIVQAAAVFEDGTVAALDARRTARVLAAKLTITENLDRLTADDPLKLFLLFSSATVPVGSPGQAAYVAANAAMEAVARRRAAAGRPACAVQWGPIADAGVLAGDEATAAGLSRRLGALALPAAQCLASLPAILASGVAVAGVARILWQQAGAALPVLAEPCFAAVRAGLEQTGDDDGPELRARVQGLPEEKALDLVRDAVRGELGRILRLPPGSIALDAPLPGLGLDSLGGMELRTGLERRMGSAVALSAVTEDLTVETLARRMLEGLRGEPSDDAGNEARIAAYEPANTSVPLKDAAE